MNPAKRGSGLADRQVGIRSVAHRFGGLKDDELATRPAIGGDQFSLAIASTRRLDQGVEGSESAKNHGKVHINPRFDELGGDQATGFPLFQRLTDCAENLESVVRAHRVGKMPDGSLFVGRDRVPESPVNLDRVPSGIHDGQNPLVDLDPIDQIRPRPGISLERGDVEANPVQGRKRGGGVGCDLDDFVGKEAARKSLAVAAKARLSGGAKQKRRPVTSAHLADHVQAWGRGGGAARSGPRRKSRPTGPGCAACGSVPAIGRTAIRGIEPPSSPPRGHPSSRRLARSPSVPAPRRSTSPGLGPPRSDAPPGCHRRAHRDRSGRFAR